MKKILLTAVIGIATMSFSFAQNHNQPMMMKKMQANPEEIAKRQTENMKKQLVLTADQEKKVYDLNLQFAKEQIKVREAMKAQRAQMLKNFRQKDSLIESLLTPEQKRFHELYKHLNKQKMQSMKKEGMKGMMMKKMQEKGMQEKRMHENGMQPKEGQGQVMQQKMMNK